MDDEIAFDEVKHKATVRLIIIVLILDIITVRLKSTSKYVFGFNSSCSNDMRLKNNY